MRDFYSAVSKRAWSDTWQFARQYMLWNAALVLASAFLGVITQGQSQLGPIAGSAVFSLAAIGLLVLGAFVAHAIAAPYRIHSERAAAIIKPQTDSAPSEHPSIYPIDRQYDGVLWQDVGRTYVVHGGVIADGPLCPVDRTTLRVRDGIETLDVDDQDQYISESRPLVCPSCGVEYVLGDGPKTVQESQAEVEAIFDGLRRSRVAAPAQKSDF